ncbi:hypothetical protein A2303_01390 [Candidatus Falkowbacteria bacterium RIFOXYB2_FULL_47_14]|uniref:Uncharacterized protein n=1 Tax=Candidatus Falkowbacteria bacterium RIFOXYA2_FULL_47_19 TaxID=1797994 RepID=A0A1F5SH22_9BACT|nr:MAG: hypothetical protein A2227_05685 [Candidatus Falkowbacteria bacterium RIFOXYA2_FULL_47_19]OGF34505.1 MAG: hypothetical protein A2468_04730 [Candidatus Falkowbacteria bacterium RIFOXYC2_FULL_46_15]OGF43543.1 MAG: hypothetical protein A2303_01390 [Candidatus Falkowbacteria bacterium RIFOXYB2_FULL_47_14]
MRKKYWILDIGYYDNRHKTLILIFTAKAILACNIISNINEQNKSKKRIIFNRHKNSHRHEKVISNI